MQEKKGFVEGFLFSVLMMGQTSARKTHNTAHLLTMNNRSYAEEVRQYFLNEIKRDLGSEGDITTEALCSDVGNDPRSDMPVHGYIESKKEGILAGIEELEWILKEERAGQFLSEFALISENMNEIRAKKFDFTCKMLKKDGSLLKKGDKILEFFGPARHILAFERTILNLLQRMSGIATQTHKIVQKVGPETLITSTRKTPFGLLDKKAVTVGGGGTHRLGLYDAFLVKDTHRKILNNDFENIFKKIRKSKRHGRFLEIEVETERQGRHCAKAFKKSKISLPFILMLDNMTPAAITKTIREVRKIDKTILFEASGGITGKNITHYAKTGVEIISLGSLTHSARALDMSLKIA